MGHTFGTVAWTMDDFYNHLKLYNVSIDIKNDLDPNFITNVKLEKLFGKRR